MPIWKKFAKAAKKTAEVAKKVQDTTVRLAQEQVSREDSALNKMRREAGSLRDKTLATVDSLEVGARSEDVAMTRLHLDGKREQKKAEVVDTAPMQPSAASRNPAPKSEEVSQQFPNSMDWSDEEVFERVGKTIYPEFSALVGDDRWALCKIACFDKEITNLNRAIGSAYIETFRQLAAHDMTYHRCLETAGVTKDPVIGDAYRCWLEDLYDEGFFADDDGGHGKGERRLGWLVLSCRGESLVQAFVEADLEDPFELVKSLTEAMELIRQRESLVSKHFSSEEESFDTEFLVHQGINADHRFAWLAAHDTTIEESGDMKSSDSDGYTEL